MTEQDWKGYEKDREELLKSRQKERDLVQSMQNEIEVMLSATTKQRNITQTDKDRLKRLQQWLADLKDHQ